MLIQTAWISGRTKPLPIYLPKELIRPLQGWLDAGYLGPEFLQFPIEFFPWETHPSLEQFDLKVDARETSHLKDLVERFGAGRFRAYSLRITHPEFRILLSGDLGSPLDLEPQLGEPLDLFVCELAHFEPEELFGFLSRHNMRRLVLTHLAPGLSGKTDELVAKAKTYLPKTTVVVAVDGLRFRL
jgi:ribonuclease BN (tRNA processing enzyme)